MRWPAAVVRRPVRRRIEPDGECLREVFIRMALRVPMVEMLHETLAVRLRRVVLGVLSRRTSEETASGRSPAQVVRVVERVSHFVAQDTKATHFVAALHL